MCEKDQKHRCQWNEYTRWRHRPAFDQSDGFGLLATGYTKNPESAADRTSMR